MDLEYLKHAHLCGEHVPKPESERFADYKSRGITPCQQTPVTDPSGFIPMTFHGSVLAARISVVGTLCRQPIASFHTI